MIYSFAVGNLKFNIWLSESLTLDTENTLPFSNYEYFKGTEVDLYFHHVMTLPQIGEEVFRADNSNDAYFQNIWRVHKSGEKIGYSITYFNHQNYKEIAFIPRHEVNKVDVYVISTKNIGTIEITPFLHPFGILLISCMQIYFGGLLIHASGVNDHGNGYLFTGVSGIGKSTMASIWENQGAQIVNDDRLMLFKEGENYIFSNTPMPYYIDVSKQAPLKAIFLLNQSTTNFCRQISGTQALSLVMANFMQQLFDSSIVEIHLEKAMDLVLKTPVYELGFKPDNEIVDLVRSLKL